VITSGASVRILFLSRVAPHSQGRPIERRFASRLEELTDLGHRVLVLSTWQPELPEITLPKHVEIRYPFRKFAAWEWPQALPLLLNWRPDILHIVDPGLSAYERLLGAEASVFPVLEGLRRGFRQISVPRVLVSTLDEQDKAWGAIGARYVESQWLSHRPLLNFPSLESRDPRHSTVRIFLAGRESERGSLFLLIPRILEILRVHQELEVSCLLSRVELSRLQQRTLLKWERRQPSAASRLHLIPNGFETELLASENWEIGIVAGLSARALHRWQERLAMPLILSEGQRGTPGHLPEDPRVMKWVSDVAWLEQSLATCLDRALREETWSNICEKVHHIVQDDATNRISRLYAEALAESTSPS
jgi:hypothetical protein